MTAADRPIATCPGFSRREWLKSTASGFGYLAFAGVAHQAAIRDAVGSDSGLAARAPHFPARAKRVIFLCMNGGPSHIDLFDPKPALHRDSAKANLMPSPFRFAQHGESGAWFSEVVPHLAGHADELCFIRSMVTDLPNHSQAFLQMHTGSFQFVRPSLGAWSLYGLGTENADLPGFVTINPPADNGGARNFGTAFLPAIYQGTKIGTQQIPGFYAALLGVDQEPGPPLKNIVNTTQSVVEQRGQIDLIRELNAHKLARDVFHPEIEGAIESFELAFRMQDEIPGLLDLASESESTLALYGIGKGLPTDRFGRQCLLGRRLAEAGVRFIELTSPIGWDHHFMLQDKLRESCLATDQPIAALLTDLKRRGMLDETLVVWAGEFGRSPTAQSGTGRDHNNEGFTVWMAGGGVRQGLTFGTTDEHGKKAVHDRVHIHDLHATMLHLLGLDHSRLTFNYGGRDFRLTDVHGTVINQIIG